MSFSVRTNVASMLASNNVAKSGRGLSDTFARVSSGLRITKAADDAAGLAVAESLDAEGRSARQASRNTNDGISAIQIAEGATNEVGEILKRMRELAVQSSSGTLGNTERGYIDSEFDELNSEITRIANASEFNGVSLTDGSNATVDIQVGTGATANDRITVNFGNLTSLGLGTAGLDTAANARTAIDTIDTAIGTVNNFRSDYGAGQNRLESSLSSMENYATNIKAAESRIRDADMAFETAQMSKYQVMQQAGVAALAQANGSSQNILRLL
ncbi:MAG: flagellin [Myxococcota bacterium]